MATDALGCTSISNPISITTFSLRTLNKDIYLVPNFCGSYTEVTKPFADHKMILRRFRNPAA